MDAAAAIDFDDGVLMPISGRAGCRSGQPAGARRPRCELLHPYLPLGFVGRDPSVCDLFHRFIFQIDFAGEARSIQPYPML